MATSSVQSLGHYPDRHILLGVAFAVVTAALLIVSGEESLLQAALIWQAPVTRNVLEGVSWLGHWGVGFGLLVVAASAGYLLRRPRLQAAGVCGLFALGLTGLFTELLKHTTCRARPFLPGGGTFLPPLCLEADMHSFPSGHATQVFAIAVILAAAYPRLTLPGYAIGVAVSLSRVALGLHYPSDVLVGAAIGLVGGALCLRSSHRLAGPWQAPSRGRPLFVETTRLEESGERERGRLFRSEVTSQRAPTTNTVPPATGLRGKATDPRAAGMRTLAVPPYARK